MRNLKNVHHSILRSPPNSVLTAATWDTSSDTLICAYGCPRDKDRIELQRWTSLTKGPVKVGANPAVLEVIASWDTSISISVDEILDLHYFPDSSTFCLVLANGDIFVVRDSPIHDEDRIETVGSVDEGITAAAWSPDEEVLAITTRANTLLYLDKDFENLVNITLSPDDLQASKHVSVGWGKSETQFKGKKARILRDPTIPERIDEGSLSDLDAKNTTISWRGDGSYVAVNRIESGRRVIQVYSRDGSLDSASEPVNGLLGALSWRPAGNLIASVQCLEGRADVVFFERNGLRHGQFPLRLAKEELTACVREMSLKWNVDSSVLAVCFKDRVQLWTMGNYHYYLKQEIFLMSPPPNGRSACVQWHPEDPLKLVVASEGTSPQHTCSLEASILI
jgi:elongator complex protein 1